MGRRGRRGKDGREGREREGGEREKLIGKMKERKGSVTLKDIVKETEGSGRAGRGRGEAVRGKANRRKGGRGGSFSFKGHLNKT